LTCQDKGLHPGLENTMAPRLLLLFDGYCGFCTRVVHWLLAHDRDCRILALPSQTPGVRERHGLTREQTDAAIWVLDAGSGRALGSAALAANILLAQLPAPWRWIPWLAFLPGVPQLQQRLYFWIAHNRGRLGRWYGTTPPCERPGALCVDQPTPHASGS